jgi:hypothetical protein
MSEATATAESKPLLNLLGDTEIEPSAWGKDHLSTLMYAETCCVDHHGKLASAHMRQGDHRIMRLGWPRGVDRPSFVNTRPSPTRLRGSEVVDGHDDWDCIDDMERAGYLVVSGTGLQPIVTLTEKGWQLAFALRRWRAEGKQLADFQVTP